MRSPDSANRTNRFRASSGRRSRRRRRRRDRSRHDAAAPLPARRRTARSVGDAHGAEPSPVRRLPRRARSSTRSMFPDQDSRLARSRQPTLDPLPEIRERRPRSAPAAATAHWSPVPVPAPPPPAAPPPRPVPPVAGRLRRAPAPRRRRSDDRDGKRRLRGRRRSASPPTRSTAPTPGRGSATRSQRRRRRCRGSPTPTLPPRRPMATMASSTARPTPRRPGQPSAAKGRKKRQAQRASARWSWSSSLLAGLVGGALMFGRDYLLPGGLDQGRGAGRRGTAAELRPRVRRPGGRSTSCRRPTTRSRSPASCSARLSHAEVATSMPRWRALGLVDGRAERRVGERGRQHLEAGVLRPGRRTDLPQRHRNRSGVRRCDAQTRSLPPWSINWRCPTAPTLRRDRCRRRDIVDGSLAQLAVDDSRRRGRRRPVARRRDPDRAALGPLPVPLAAPAARCRRPRQLRSLESLGVVRRPRRGGRRVRRRRHRACSTCRGRPHRLRRMLDRRHAGRRAGAAVARGSDFWYTVLAAYLPAETAADAANSIGADLLRPGASVVHSSASTARSPRPTPGGARRVAGLGSRMGRRSHRRRRAHRRRTLADGVTVQLVDVRPGHRCRTPTRSPGRRDAADRPSDRPPRCLIESAHSTPLRGRLAA